MSLSPFTKTSLHHRHCLSAAMQTWQQRRGFKAQRVNRLVEKEKEQRKSLARQAYDLVGAPLPWPVEPKEENVFQRVPKYMVPIVPPTESPLYREKPSYAFNREVKLHEGLPQALWLTKSVVMDEGKMPKQLQELASTIEIPDMEERVHRSIRSCRQYDTMDKMIKKDRVCYNQTMSLIHLSGLLGLPDLSVRPTAEEYYLSAAWYRGEDEILVRGRCGILMLCKKPLPVLATREEMESTIPATMPSFHPLAPTIDLWMHNVVKKDYNFTGLKDPQTFPHAHTLFTLNHDWRLEPAICQGFMFAFGNAMCRAKLKYGVDSTADLPEPIVTQAIVTDGVKFSFVHVQLNTLNMVPDDGVKNMVWIDQDNDLFRDEYPQDMKILNKRRNRPTRREIVRKNKKKDPEVGCQDLDISVFRKFLACIANGAVN